MPVWSSGVESIRVKLQGILDGWRGTQYKDGAQSKGVGVDCVRFVAGVMDELGGTTTTIESLPRDVYLHDPALARASMRQIIKEFSPTSRLTSTSVIPGDVLAVGPVNGGPGHAMIVGYADNSLWEVTTVGVTKSSYAALYTNNRTVFHAYRLVNTTNRWLTLDDLLPEDEDLAPYVREPVPLP